MKPSPLNRRDFIKVNAATAGMAFAGIGTRQAMGEPTPKSHTPLIDVDFDAVIARSDLLYLSPVESPGEGQPIGNGRMGTMVWTTPSSVQFQINRVDVFAVNRDHRGHFMEHACGACASIAVDVGGQPFAKSDHFQQHLSLYNAESTMQGADVHVRCFVSAVSDVLIVEVDDQRPEPQPLRLTLSLWGEPSVKTGEHLARFAFVEDGKTHGVTRTFTEQEYYCRSTVAVQAANSRMHVGSVTPTQRTFRIERATGGKTRILISSAASMNAKVDVAAQAFQVLETVAGRSYAQLRTPHEAWWAHFWARTFVHMSSPDGVADFMERLRTVHLYVMASISRGKIAPKWNDMLFGTSGDTRPFGPQFWGWCMEAIYLPLFAAGASDLADPYFNMYVAQLPQCRIAAAQRWDAKGAVFSEVLPFDGPQTLPDDVAREYRNILLHRPDRKPLSDRARKFGMSDVPLFDFAVDGLVVADHYTQTSHVWTAGAKVGMHAWWRYRCTGDTAWLRTHAYPLLRDSSEFYRSVATKKADGKYHIEFSNVLESYPGVKDGIVDLAAVRGIVPLAIRSAEILKLDPDLRAQWHEFLANLTPYAMGSEPESKALDKSVLADDVWAIAHLGDGAPLGADEEALLTPLYPFEAYTMETNDKETTRIVNKLMDLMPAYKTGIEGTVIGVSAARTPIYVARLGRGEALPKLLSTYCRAFPILPNGLSPFEAGALSAEHLGVVSTTVQEGLLQSLSPTPGEAEIIRVFPAWPKSWEGVFTLMARGGFLVTSTIQKGVIPFVEIESRLGGTCRIHNPWNTPCFLAENGKKKQAQSGDLLKFETKAGKKYQLFPGDFPTSIRVAPTRTPQALLSFKQADGTMDKKRLGRER